MGNHQQGFSFSADNYKQIMEAILDIILTKLINKGHIS